MKHLNLFENFTSQENIKKEDVFKKIASVIKDGLRESKLKFKVDIHNDESYNLVMDLIFDNLSENESGIALRNVKLAMSSFNDDFDTLVSNNDHKFIITISNK